MLEQMLTDPALAPFENCVPSSLPDGVESIKAVAEDLGLGHNLSSLSPQSALALRKLAKGRS